LNYHFTKMLDPSDWPNLPNGSVAFFDECQDFFPPINSAAKKPESYDRFRTHRHKGVDIHLITQHGSFVDTIIRFTCNRHVHFFNPNNGDKLKRFQKNKYFDVDNSTAREACEITTVTRDKSFYGVYWSADEHTAKFKLPKAYITIAVLVAVM
ncbi:zonular occludens toxin domain-containing protein, partial [Donghicola sp. XS_ASV15]|uniref:zonular occludens toxin domain-containing protein n=1 Tax=Donghicola sp. XS_ASV15 TaxID=3241295 RepID=UPI00351750A8